MIKKFSVLFMLVLFLSFGSVGFSKPAPQFRIVIGHHRRYHHRYWRDRYDNPYYNNGYRHGYWRDGRWYPYHR
ncbi:MAG TPA: hypothetical protein VFC63_03610 [Blastocatellia bacterium]|nr:hypothetical protein [Blastocatellia bacterium]